MRVAVDVRCLSGSNHLQGVSQYTKHLVSNLLNIQNMYFRLFPGFKHPRKNDVYSSLPPLPDKSRWAWSPVPMHFLERLWRIGWPPVEWITGDVDIFFEPNFFIPPLRSAKAVVTIHDLSFQRYPEFFPYSVAKKRIVQLSKTLKSTDAVIAVSHFTADEICTLWPNYRTKVHVVHEAPGPEFCPQSQKKIQEIINRLELKAPFILYVGALELRKNVTSLAQAYLKLRRSGKTKCQLVLAGSPGYGAENIMRIASSGIEKGWIRYLGFVPQQDLPALYAASDVFCYISLYEGFGLPPLEALACGTPVLVSRIPVFEEVLGSQAYYVNPSDIEDISKGIALCEERAPSSLKERLNWTANFSWEKTALKTADIFKEVA
ncbi:MAG: glycosyltransferase [Candidatus Aminicenantes bacterium]|nr:glycosyltransferase [Candidatus Aminicenantes bacterium]